MSSVLSSLSAASGCSSSSKSNSSSTWGDRLMKESEWACFSWSNSLLYQWIYSALRVPSPIPCSLAEDVCIEYSSNHSCANFRLSSLNLTMWSLANTAGLLWCLLSASTIPCSGERTSCLWASPPSVPSARGGCSLFGTHPPGGPHSSDGSGRAHSGSPLPWSLWYFPLDLGGTLRVYLPVSIFPPLVTHMAKRLPPPVDM